MHLDKYVLAIVGIVAAALAPALRADQLADIKSKGELVCGVLGTWHADRYARAREFYQVVTGLWETWDEGAVLADQASGQYFDPSAVRRLNHKGEHFSVKGNR